MGDRTATLVRVLAGTGLTAGLVAFGLFVTGTGTRAHALLLAPALSRHGVDAMEGSISAEGEVLVDGQPTQVSDCWSVSRSPGEVLHHYEALARSECGTLPFLAEDTPGGGGSLVWVTEDGTRRAVIVRPDSRGGTSYRILETGAPVAQTDAGRSLPGGVTPPAGADVLLSVVSRDGSGTALLRASGPVEGVAARCASALEARGFTVDSPPSGRGGTTLTVSDARGPRGTVVIAQDGDGARVSLTLRRAD